ncbi:MAG TPA: cytochrome c [Candidatus Hypogeohydataceae bacterium YC41]
MKRLCFTVLSGVGILLATGSVVCGDDSFRSDTPQVKSTMKTLDEYLNKVEDAIIAEDLPKAASMAKELDTACHKLCDLDLSNSKLSKSDLDEFKKLREDFHYRVERLDTAAKQSSVDIAQFEFEKARQSCENCHRRFRKKA